MAILFSGRARRPREPHTQRARRALLTRRPPSRSPASREQKDGASPLGPALRRPSQRAPEQPAPLTLAPDTDGDRRAGDGARHAPAARHVVQQCARVPLNVRRFYRRRSLYRASIS